MFVKIVFITANKQKPPNCSLTYEQKNIMETYKAECDVGIGKIRAVMLYLEEKPEYRQWSKIAYS